MSILGQTYNAVMRSVLVTMLVSLGMAALVLGLRVRPANDEVLARRLLLLRGDLSTPKVVLRNDPDVLEVVSAHGRTEFVQQPSCDERLLCSLGFTLLCWDVRL